MRKRLKKMALSKQDILDALKIRMDAPFLIKDEEARKKAKATLLHKPTLSEILDTIDIFTSPSNKEIQDVKKDHDVLSYILTHDVKITEKQWDKAEKAVEKANKLAVEKIKKEYEANGIVFKDTKGGK